MNKQEFQQTIKNMKYKKDCVYMSSFEVYLKGFEKAKELALLYSNSLDEPEKPVVPQYVADWIEWCKKHKVTLLGSIIAVCNNKNIRTLDASGWATKNQETFTKAWFYGYEVEKEKQYVVVIPEVGRNGFMQLWKNKEGKLLFNFEDKIRYGEVYLLTEQEIKQRDERLLQFAEEVNNNDD